MIWTVIMKDGNNFVVHGASFDRESEVRKSLTGRGWRVENVAGVVQGNHHVTSLEDQGIRPTFESIHKARQAAMQGPIIRDNLDDMEHVLGGGERKAEISNDPVEW